MDEEVSKLKGKLEYNDDVESFFDALFKIVEDLGPNSGFIRFILGMTLIITMRHMII